MYITSAGDITYHDVKKLLHHVLRTPPDFGSHLRCLTDFSQIKCTLTQKEIRKLQRIFKIKSPDFHIRHAHITPPEDELKASVFFAIFSEDRDDIHTCIFQKKNLAKNWLGCASDFNIQNLYKEGFWN